MLLPSYNTMYVGKLVALFGFALFLTSFFVYGNNEAFAQTTNTCGLALVSGDSIFYNDLQSGSISSEAITVLSNPGTVAATLSVFGTDWQDASQTSVIDVSETRLSFSTGNFASKIPLSLAFQDIGTLQPSVNTDTFWQLQANLLNPPFTGDLTQVMTFRVECESVAAAPVVDTVSTGTGSNDLTFSHTVSGSDRLLLVATAIHDGAQTVISITYDGVSLTLVDTAVNSGVAGELWQLVNPNAGTADVVIDFSNGFVSTGAAISFTGVDQTTPLGTSVSATGSSASASVSVSSATGELVFSNVAAANTPTSGETQQWSVANGEASSGGGTDAGASSVTMSFSLTSAEWAIIGVSIKPVAGG